MEEEKSILDFTQDELIRFIQMQRRIYALEEYQSMKINLLDRVKRILDLRDLMKITMSNHKRVRRVINKYAKPCKKEADTKKLLKKQELEENMIGARYVSSVMNLMELVHKVLYTEAFEKDLPALEKWYEFEMEDMVLVNDVIRGLKYFDSLDVTEDDVLGALNFAVEQYVDCIENNTEYADTFDSSFPFVQIRKEEKENANE